MNRRTLITLAAAFILCCGNAVAQEKTESIAVPQLLRMMQKGKASGLKRVLVRFEDHKEIVITLRAEGTRYYLTEYDKKKVLGDIDVKTGRLNPTKRLTADMATIIRRMEKDPAQFCKAHGLKTGKCCFCRRKLTDPRSVKAGMGQVCAERYGLPWGN